MIEYLCVLQLATTKWIDFTYWFACCVGNSPLPKTDMRDHRDGLVQDCGISSASAIEISQFCSKPDMRYVEKELL